MLSDSGAATSFSDPLTAAGLPAAVSARLGDEARLPSLVALTQAVGMRASAAQGHRLRWAVAQARRDLLLADRPGRGIEPHHHAAQQLKPGLAACADRLRLADLEASG